MKKTIKYFDRTVKIPDDVIKAIVKRMILRVLAFIFLEALAVTAAYFFSRGSGLLATQMTYIIACLIPFALTKFPFAFFDKTYIGRIERIDVETVSRTETAMKLFNKNIVSVYIRLESGDVEVRKANEGKIRNSGIVSEFKEGNIAMHLYGTDYIVPVPENKTRALNKKCFICGQTSPNEATECYHCHHSLLSND